MPVSPVLSFPNTNASVYARFTFHSGSHLVWFGLVWFVSLSLAEFHGFWWSENEPITSYLPFTKIKLDKYK